MVNLVVNFNHAQKMEDLRHAPRPTLRAVFDISQLSQLHFKETQYITTYLLSFICVFFKCHFVLYSSKLHIMLEIHPSRLLKLMNVHIPIHKY